MFKLPPRWRGHHSSRRQPTWERAGPGRRRSTGSSRSPLQALRAHSGRASGTRREQAARQARAPATSPLGLPSRRRRSQCTLTHLLLLRGGCLRDFRGHSAPSATRRREKMRFPGGRGRPAAAPPQARPPPLSERPRKWPAPYDDTEPRRAQPPATAASPGRPPLPRRAPTYLTPLLRLCDTEALPLFLQRSRLAPHLTSVGPDASWEL